jgi:dihydrofolate reductase
MGDIRPEERMGRLIYSFNVSLDGYIETVDKSLDWSVVDPEVHHYFEEQTRALDASLYGRRLWDLMSAHWPYALTDPETPDWMRGFAEAWATTPKFVFSHSLDHVEHGARLMRGDVGEALATIRREFDGELEVAGANLAAQFIERGLVDEYRLMLHPVALGGGTPFWPAGQRVQLREIDTRAFPNGARLITYVPA